MWRSVGSSTTVSSAIASATVTIPADAAGNTTGVLRRLELATLSGGAHIKFLVGTTVGAATTNDYLIGTDPRHLNVPGGCTTIAHIAANAVTSILNIASIETS